MVVTEQGYSVKPELMAWVWQTIEREGKVSDLFYGGGVKNIHDWLNYIYHPQNYVVLVLEKDTDKIRHIAWINKYYQNSAYCHHCAIGNYHRQTWPTLKKYWSDMLDNSGKPLIYTLIGVTPVINKKAVKLLKIIGWNVVGEIPGICYISDIKQHVSGIISYAVINEVGYGRE